MKTTTIFEEQYRTVIQVPGAVPGAGWVIGMPRRPIIVNNNVVPIIATPISVYLNILTL